MTDLNEYMFNRRIVHEGIETMQSAEMDRGRANLYNPWGVTPREAAARIEETRRNNPEKFAAIEAAANAYRAIREEVLFPILEQTGVLSAAQYETMVENWAYGRCSTNSGLSTRTLIKKSGRERMFCCMKIKHCRLSHFMIIC